VPTAFEALPTMQTVSTHCGCNNVLCRSLKHLGASFFASLFLLSYTS
jgi:hypothetical protein